MDNQTDKPLPHEPLLQEAYQQWFNNPVTQLFIKILNKRKDNCVNFIGVNVARLDVNDAQFRQYGFTLKASSDILDIVVSYEKFLEQLKETLKDKLKVLQETQKVHKPLFPRI